MSKKLTTTQHSAFGDLNRFGRLYPCEAVRGGARGTPWGFSGKTLQALVDAGHARWATIWDRTGPGEARRVGIVPSDTDGAADDPVVITEHCIDQEA